MKIALAQINTTVGALEYNVAKIRHYIEKARSQGADIIIFPELTITGYPPKDLVEYPWFIEKNLKMLDEVVACSRGIGVIVGYIDVRYDNVGKNRFNSAALIDDGKIVSRHFKSLLPTYDVFDEGRYFESAREVRVAEFRSRRLGITICEDIWNDELYWRHRLYEFDPVEALAQQGFDLLINISASPFCLGKRQIKREMLAATARRYQRPLIQINLVGGNDDLIFDGWSTVMNSSGEIVARCPEFEEALLLYDTEIPD
ncbi:MAG: NAD+ synthase, partial [Candidatus Sumerlaeia bacterium]|nr:NAD+ synthase [Candidatus Sumerlaeia bacterium]